MLSRIFPLFLPISYTIAAERLKYAALAILLPLMVLIAAFAPQHASALSNNVEKKIVFIGDDFFASTGVTTEEETFSNQFKRTIAESRWNIRTSGVVFMPMENIDTLSILPMIPNILAENADVVIIALGYNDAQRRIDPEIIYNNLDVLINEISRTGVYIMLVGLEASPSIEYQYASAFNNIYSRLAERNHVYYVSGTLKEVNQTPTLLRRNSTLPNVKGTEVIAYRITEHLTEVMRLIRRFDACEASKRMNLPCSNY